MSQILWIGSYLDDKTFLQVNTLGYRNASAHISQRNLVEGIETCLKSEIDSIGLLSMAGYPKDNQLSIPRIDFSDRESYQILAGCINILYLNKIAGKHSLEQETRKWIENRYKDGERLDVFIYAMTSANLCAASVIKKRIPKSHIHLIVPDLPQFMDLRMSKLKKMLKDLDWNLMLKQLHFIDDFVLYAESMLDFLDIGNRPYRVMEGTINQSDINKLSSIQKHSKSGKTSVKSLMYSGALSRDYGLNVLLDLVEELDEDWQLWITGFGEFEDELKKKSIRNNKLKFFGFLENRDELLTLESQATVLINARIPSREDANYCFPSKLFEYMLLGKPVISGKLRGIPEEYKRYLFLLDDFSVSGIKSALRNIDSIEASVMKKRMQDEKNFISMQKNNIVQAKKLLEFCGLKLV